jgi:hypothetical protein
MTRSVQDDASATIADHDIEVVATGGLMSAAPSLKLGKHCNFPVIRCGMVAPASKNNNRFCLVDWKTTTRVPVRLIVLFWVRLVLEGLS